MATRSQASGVIVVLGMHRAGTSLCGRILHWLGADFGSGLISPRADNPEGLYEHPGIVRISTGINALLNRRLTSPTGALPFPAGWTGLPDVLEQKRALAQLLLDEIAQAKSVFTFKDPNSLRILPLWQEIFAEHGVSPRYVVTVRGPRPVALSLARRDGITPAQGELLWAAHYADAIRYLDGRLNCVVSFDGWFENPERQVARLVAALGFEAPRDPDALQGELRALVRPDLRHHDALERCENPCAQRIHEALLEAMDRAIDPQALKASIAPLDDALKALEPIAASLDEMSSGNVRRILRRFESAGWLPRDWPPLAIVARPAARAAGETPAEALARPLRIGIVMPPGELATTADALSHEDRGFLGLARVLAAEGHAVSVYFVERPRAVALAGEYLARRRAAMERIAISSLEEGAVPCSLPGGAGHVAKAARVAYIAYEGLRDAGLDVLHFCDTRAPAYFVICAKASALNFQRTAVCVHLLRPNHLVLRQEQRLVSDPTHVIWNAMEDFCAAEADYVASATSFMFRALMERGAARRAGSVYLPWPLPTSWGAGPAAEAPGTGETAPPARLMYLGPLTMRGGVHLFCDALRRLYRGASGDVVLPSSVAFISEEQTSAEVAAVRAQVGDIDVPVEFLVAPDRADRLPHYRDTQALFVAPSLCENPDYLALECAQAGAGVLISSAGGTAEFLSAPDPILVNPHPHDIADAIRRAGAGGAPRGKLHPRCHGAADAWGRWHRALEFAAESNRNVVAELKESARAAVRLQGGEDWASHAGRYDDKAVLAEALPVDELLADIERSVELRAKIAAVENPPADPGEAPLVSVVLAHYERPALVAQAIRSIAAQSYPRLELILVDDGSGSPRTKEFLDRLEAPFARVGWRVLRNANLSPGASRNRGAEAARGDYVLCVDDDNVALPHEIAVMMHAARHADADVVTCFRDSFGGDAPPSDALPAKLRIVALGGLSGVAPIANCFGDANVLVKRNTYLRVGGYVEHHRTGKEDYEFFVRLLMAGATFAVVPEALYWYRQLRVRRRNFHYNQMSGYLTVMSAFERHVPAAFRDVLAYARSMQFDDAPARAAGSALDGDVSRLFNVHDVRGDELVVRIRREAWETGAGRELVLTIIRGDGQVTEIPIGDRSAMEDCVVPALPGVYRLRLPAGEGARILAGEFEVHLEVRFSSGQRSSALLARHEGYRPSERRYSGVCERVAGRIARGWIFDELKLTWAVPLVAYVNDEFIGACLPIVPRPDLQRHYPARTAKGDIVERELPGRGFEIAIPDRFFAAAGAEITLELRPAFTPYHLRRTPISGLVHAMAWDRDKKAWAPVE